MWTIALAVGVLGCGPHRMRAYDGPPRPASEVALLIRYSWETVWRDSIKGRALIRKVDGAPVGFAVEEIELTPGRHRVELSYSDPLNQSVCNATVDFEARAGRRYLARGERLRSGVVSEIGRTFAAALSPWPLEGEWVGWIVDAETGAVVGGRAPHGTAFTTTLEGE